MEIINEVYSFFVNLPQPHRTLTFVLAGVGVVFFTIAFFVAISAPKYQKENAGDAEVGKTVDLVIERIDLPDHRREDQVQLRLFVNGNTYRHPSVGNVDWMVVGNGNDRKTIKIPAADEYNVRFEISAKGNDGDIDEGLSQEVIGIKQLPFNGSYQVYLVDGLVRSGSVEATVWFKVE